MQVDFNFNQHKKNYFYFKFLKNLFLFITVVILAIHLHVLNGLPLIEDDDDNNNNYEHMKRSDENFLPNEMFSLVTNEKLFKLQELANAVHDPKLHELYRVVKHYVQLAAKNNEYVLWKYDANREGLVLTLKQNLNGILYYG
jgi:hypothetical protein